MKRFILLAVSTGFGLGFSPIMPGTVGSIPGFITLWLIYKMNWYNQIIINLILFVFGIIICNLSLYLFDNKDPRQITIDEIVSIPITFFLIDLNIKTLIIGFILNRVFDILKPCPAFQSQKLPKGYGIMTDDLISGIYSNITLRLVLLFV